MVWPGYVGMCGMCGQVSRPSCEHSELGNLTWLCVGVGGLWKKMRGFKKRSCSSGSTESQISKTLAGNLPPWLSLQHLHPPMIPSYTPLTKILAYISWMRQKSRMQAGRMEGPVCVVQFKEELFASCCKCIIYFINKKTNHNHKYLNSSKSSTCGGQYHDMWEKIPLHFEMHRRQF